MWVARHNIGRFFNRARLSLLVLFLLVLCLAQTATAQQNVSISPSVVLVLKLVSNTHVKPTTGIVISDNGQVLVPADFVLGDGEIIVLDGGTDVVTNGRPAKIVAAAGSSELAVLSVEGLKRPGITLSDNAISANNTLRLEAFPPAEYIAKGEPPLMVAVEVFRVDQSRQISISPETPLPYVSGAIVDACGYLAGVSFTSGLQSLDTDRPPLTLLDNELANVFETMQITLPKATCKPSLEQTETPGVETDNKDEIVDAAQTQAQSPETNESESLDIETPPLPVVETTSPPSQEMETDRVRPVTPKVSEPPSVWRKVPWWIPLLGIIILGVVAWKMLFFFRLNKKTVAQASNIKPAGKVQPASDEPATMALVMNEDGSVVKPRSAPVLDFEIPDSDMRPDGCNAVLVVEGLLDADTPFRRFCFVNSEQINIIIGRGDKDINIEHAAISRAHVRIESDGELMTLSDLGSKNGSFIGDIACLPGEVLYFEAADEIFLGEVKLSIRVVEQRPEWA
jgi:hypothetical protein